MTKNLISKCRKPFPDPVGGCRRNEILNSVLFLLGLREAKLEKGIISNLFTGQSAKIFFSSNWSFKLVFDNFDVVEKLSVSAFQRNQNRQTRRRTRSIHGRVLSRCSFNGTFIQRCNRTLEYAVKMAPIDSSQS